jgi:hypothetical protein
MHGWSLKKKTIALHIQALQSRMMAVPDELDLKSSSACTFHLRRV